MILHKQIVLVMYTLHLLPASFKNIICRHVCCTHVLWMHGLNMCSGRMQHDHLHLLWLCKPSVLRKLFW